MNPIPSVNVRIDPAGGPVSVEIDIDGDLKITTDVSVWLQQKAGAQVALVSKNPNAPITAIVPGAASALPGSSVECDAAIVSNAANQSWRLKFTALQGGAIIGTASDPGSTLGQSGKDMSVLTLVFQ